MSDERGDNVRFLLLLPFMPLIILFQIIVIIGGGIATILLGGDTGRRLADEHPSVAVNVFYGIIAITAVGVLAAMFA